MSEDLIERLRIELDEQHELRSKAENDFHRMRAKLAEAEKVIEPFAELGRDVVNEHGWTKGHGNERLCAWIGPSDLRAAAEFMEKGE